VDLNYAEKTNDKSIKQFTKYPNDRKRNIVLMKVCAAID